MIEDDYIKTIYAFANYSLKKNKTIDKHTST